MSMFKPSDFRGKSLRERFWMLVERRADNECWLWTGRTDRYGYGLIQDGETKRDLRAHRVSFKLHKGRFPKRGVLHTCDTTSCVNPGHLYAGTQKRNLRDASERGRIQHGARHYSAKLTEAIVLEMRARAANGESHAALASEMGVAQPTATRAINRQTWTHV